MFRSEILEYNERRSFTPLIIIGVLLLAVLAGVLVAGVVPGFANGGYFLNVDGNVYSPSQISGPVRHYETPDTNPSSAFSDRHTWNGVNGADHLPCPNGIHWIDNSQLLTISHCLEGEPTSTPTDVPPTSTPTDVPPTETPTEPPPTSTPTPECEECEPTPTPTFSPTPPTECRLVPQYIQWKLWDSDQGENYIANCYIISVEPPSVERQEALCTLCTDQLEVDGYRYQADRWRRGTVYLNECTGEYVFIFDSGSTDEDWSTHWFRPYMVDNIRTTPRCPSCEAQLELDG